VVGLLLLALLVALHLMSSAVQNSDALSRAFVPLLLVVLAGLAALLAMVGFNIVRLVNQRRRGAPGSRLTARIVLLLAFCCAASTPGSTWRSTAPWPTR